MNRDQSVVLLQSALNFLTMVLAKALSDSEPEIRDRFDIASGSVLILKEGRAVYISVPALDPSAKRSPGFSISDYTAIVSPDYEPVEAKVCEFCGAPQS